MNQFCIKEANWPDLDRKLWHEARVLGSFLSGHKPAANWSARRCRIVEQGYGQLLAFQMKCEGFNASVVPAERLTPTIFDAFVLELQKRVSPWSMFMYAQGAFRALMVMAPGQDWTWMRKIVSALKRTARPVRDRRSHMVSPDQLYELGVSLANSGCPEKCDYFRATQFRDGLMIAVLICSPVRIVNLMQITIGQRLIFDKDRYLLAFEAAETKTNTEYLSELPPELTPLIDLYLSTHRPVLLSRCKGCPTQALWIDRFGQPMAEAAIRAQIKKRTRDAFGKHVWPHLFRHIAATGIVDQIPEQAALIPELLGHSSMKTGERHYILAQAALAHGRYLTTLAARQAEALERLKKSRNGWPDDHRDE